MLRVAEPGAGRDQRLRQPRVVVGEDVLGPVPVRRRVRALQVGEPAGEARAGPRWRRRRRSPGSARARPSAAKAIVRGQRCSASAGSISRSRIRLGSRSARTGLGGDHLAERPGGATEVIAAVRLVEPAAVVGHEVAHAARARRSRRGAGSPGCARASGGRPRRRWCWPSPSATIARRATSSMQ